MPRESSFNMTRGGGVKILREDSKSFETLERGALKKLGGAPKIFIPENQQEEGGGGAPKKLNR